MLWVKQNHSAGYRPKVLQGQTCFGESSFTVRKVRDSFSLSAKIPSTPDTL